MMLISFQSHNYVCFLPATGKKDQPSREKRLGGAVHCSWIHHSARRFYGRICVAVGQRKFHVTGISFAACGTPGR
jgi:hypothetical protein